MSPRRRRTPTPRERILLEHKLAITPIDQPLFAWPDKPIVGFKDYLPVWKSPYGAKVAAWQKETFHLAGPLEFRAEPSVAPLRPNATTLVCLFYPDNEHSPRRPIAVYLERLSRLAALGEQTIVYAPPSMATMIRRMRSDPHWHIVDCYRSIWDLPNNEHQFENFSKYQSTIFRRFNGFSKRKGWYPDATRDHAHRSASYNAKAFVTYDAVMRNPFGSDRWMYVDAGILDEHGPVGADGRIWGDILAAGIDDAKIGRAIGMSGDTGIVIGEYMQSPAYGNKDINHECWTDPTKAWLCHQFIAHAYIGSSLGMLNYSIRYMQTVDDMDANGWYSAREEFVMPWVAIRYPHTVFSIPWLPVPAPLWCRWQYPIRTAFTAYGGPDSVAAIVDPIATMYCKGYQPRGPALKSGGIYRVDWRKSAYTTFRKLYYSMWLRWLTKEARNRFGNNAATDFLLSL